MKQYKVCVYAICKNEEKFVKRWYESIKDADYICVLDTGSTDNTVKLLKELGVKVEVKEINPWRFDVARNESLKLIPKDADICIPLDLDEVLIPNSIDNLIKSWSDDVTRAKYIYNWKLDKDNKPIVSFYTNKIHSNNDYIWTHPVHEVLTYCGKSVQKEILCNDVIINHYPDDSKSRGSYLKLLELSVKEDPLDDRNMHYLGREYMYYRKWNKCIDTLIKHLNLKTATWKDERCASMRFIARSYRNLNRIEEAKMWLDKAISEAPYLRDPYVEKAMLEYELENWNEVIKNCNTALKITTHTKCYINETFSFDNTIYDLLSIAYFYLDDIDNAIINIDKALKMEPDNERLLKNKEIFIATKKTK